jgi:CHAT domain-containing protein
MFKDYALFDIRIRNAGSEQYAIDFRSVLGGDETDSFIPPTSNPAYQQLAEQLQRFEIDEDGLVELGQLLFQSLFTGKLKEVYTRSQGRLKDNQGLRLRFDIDPALVEIARLPWEFLYDPDQGPLAMLDAPIVRYLSQQAAPPTLQAALPLKVLVTGAVTPPEPDVNRELTEVRAALADLEQKGQVTIQIEEHLTRTKLQRLVRSGFHIWHFIGHGALSRDGSSGTLLFEDASGAADAVSARELGIFLNRSGLQLIVLDACGSAQLMTDPYRSIAPALIRAQVPAVVAMQFKVPQEATRAFAGEFYRTLAEGFPLDACVTEGRKAVLGMSGLRNPDWGIPVVYTRAPDGRLFDLQAMAAPEMPPPSHSNGINITIGSGQQLDRSSINISNIGNTSYTEGHTPMSEKNDYQNEDVANLREEIALNRRRLSKFRKQAALTGAMTDPAITIQIEDLQREILDLDRQLKQLESATTDTTVLPTPRQVSSPLPVNPISSSQEAEAPRKDTGIEAQESVRLTLRMVPQADVAQITWEADVLGRSSSIFRSPYDSTALPLVIKALDSFQYGREFANERLNPDERAQLIAMGLWTDNQPVPTLHKRVGQALYEALVADPAAATALSTARNIATSQGLPLSYLLRFPSDAVDLAALPWELLWDKNSALLLSRGKQAAFVRYLDLDQALPPPSPPGNRLRILAIAPNAGILPEVRETERMARNTAWADLISSGLVELEELSPATPMKLVDRVQNGPPIDIVHFYGHGRYKDGQGALLFDSASGQSWISAERLAALLGDARLILLHACQSSMTGEEGLLTGVSPALSAAGVPIVVAMQLTVRADAATRFAEVIYRGLARGESVQRAVAQARQALYFEEEDGASWYVPTLTIRARDTGPLRLVRMPS